MSSLSEFSIIQQYFAELTATSDDVVLGIGDDCALLAPEADKLLAVSIDTLVEGVHFFKDVNPETLGHKSLAVSLSDLAAMGAKPAWFTLALTLPEVDESWLKAFSMGLANLANQFGIKLVGGDTTHGPLSISIQVHGWVDKTQALRRDAAQVGDLIYVTGTLGDAGAALQTRLKQWQPQEWQAADFDFVTSRLEQPTPRLAIAQQLNGIVRSGIDISDGLLADLGHILEKSGVGAEIELTQLPLSSSLQKLEPKTAYQLALGSGDDYELCFTIPVGKQAQLEALNLDVHCIGSIVEGSDLVIKENGERSENQYRKGYDHFI